MERLLGKRRRGSRSRRRGCRMGRLGGGRRGMAKVRGRRGLVVMVAVGRKCGLFGRRFGRALSRLELRAVGSAWEGEM